MNTATEGRSVWKESWVSIHHDGSVTLAAAVGGHPARRDESLEGRQIRSASIECAIADLTALIRTTAEATSNNEYDIRVGIEWRGDRPLTILTMDDMGYDYDGVSIPLHRYTPVETTVNALESSEDFYWHVHDLAEDCLNQGGVSNVQMIRPPARDDQASSQA